MRYQITVLLFLLFGDVVGKKIKERFDPWPPGFMFYASSPGGVMKMDNGMDADTHLNISMKAGDQKIGEVINETTCEYDGLIGEVQRNEVNLMGQVVRPDSTPCEPGIFMTIPELDDSPKIYSVKRMPKDDHIVDILYLWTNFSLSVWSYLILTLILSSVIFMYINYLLGARFKVRASIMLLFESVWNYYQLFIDLAPTSFLPFASSASILWTCICLALVYAVHMILMGTLSTDMTVPVPVRSLDNLQELLYDPHFNETLPVIFRQLNMYSVLKRSRENTDERVLFDKIAANENDSVISASLQNVQGGAMLILKTMARATRGEIVIIENSQILTPAAIHVGCHLNSEIMGQIKPASDVIAQSMLSGLLSKETPPSVTKYFRYRYLAAGELGLMMGKVRAMSSRGLKSFGLDVTIKGIVCAERFQKASFLELDGSLNDDSDGSIRALDMKPFARFINICVTNFIVAATVLIYEHLKYYQESYLYP